ncbi:MAG TPA: hypothetical protein VK902_09710 [Rubrobacter sp.]|nr:hypothetical protein [Rubrobacter sp.]
MRAIRSAWSLVKEYRRAYLILNLIYYGLIAGGMVYVAFDPALQKTMWDEVGEAFGTGPMRGVIDAYSSGQVLVAAVLTFAVNLIVGSFVFITVPSLIIPFSGLLIGVYRALLWGLLFSPSAAVGAGLVFHLPTIILEGQAYVLAMLAAYVQGMAFVRPRSAGAKTRREGYREGVKRSVRIYLLVAIVLFVAAVYEAVSVIFIIR